MEVEKVNINDIVLYNNNAKRHPKKQIEQIKLSIQKYGFNDPIAIDENNVIIEGHGRYTALKELGYNEIECIRLTHLKEEDKKAYILVHNKLNMETGFEPQKLFQELGKIKFDMSKFGFNIDKTIDDIYKSNERERTNETYNLDLFNLKNSTRNFWQMPVINNDNYIPKDLIGFNYAKTFEDKEVGIHFYIDDYQFERLWNNPKDYVELLRKYDCILSPDFSLYMDMPMPMKIWNVYRSRLIGQYYQRAGIKVIPTISWAEEDTFNFCFEGIPKGSIVSISTVGVRRYESSMEIWRKGVEELIKRISPKAILVYGGKIEYDFKDINVIYYENKVTERMKK